jgi:pectate lyase
MTRMSRSNEHTPALRATPPGRELNPAVRATAPLGGCPKRWGRLSEPAWASREFAINPSAARRADPTFSRPFRHPLRERNPAVRATPLVAALDRRICSRRTPHERAARRAGCVCLLAVLAFSAIHAGEPPRPIPQVPAFPGAEGAGAITRGGRGGRVIAVTNLHDAGPGSLRAAVEAGGPRTVVFHVSGLITLQSPLLIEHPFITIAGQTAPGDGICIRGATTEINASEVIIRYLRFRRGDLAVNDDALNAHRSPGRIIIDHCSFSWGLDENVSVYRYMKRLPDGRDQKLPIENVTIQWSISSEALNPRNHAFGATWGGRNASFHHNLFANNTGRNPSIGWGDHVDFRNNVIFNWRHRNIDGGDSTSVVNIVANYFKAGPATQPGRLQHRIARPEIFRTYHERPEPGWWYIADNYVAGHPEITADNWAGGVQFDPPPGTDVAAVIARGRAAQPGRAVPIAQQTAEHAYELVLARAGATLPRRDAIDERVVREVRSGQPTFGNGIINTPADVGGWPEYRSIPAFIDTDGDGMPDAWERRYGLNPHDPADGPRDADRDGYTNLEEYLNGTNPREFIDYTKAENNVNTL